MSNSGLATQADQADQGDAKGRDQTMADKPTATQQKPTDRSSPGRGPTNADTGESGRERRNTEQRSPKDGEV